MNDDRAHPPHDNNRSLEALSGYRAPPGLAATIVARARATPQTLPAGQRLWAWLTGPELRPGGWQPALLGVLLLLVPLAGGYLAGAGAADTGAADTGAAEQSELEALAVELTWSAFDLSATEVDLEL